MCQIWEEVKQEGLQQGRDQEKENTAVRMLESKELSLEKIAQFVGLPLADVKKLAEKKQHTL